MSQSIEAASREWRNGLIDVGGNNRLLNYRNGASTLVFDEAPRGALRKLMHGEKVRLSELFPDLDSLQRAQKACTILARKQREAVEEYGISVTYLAAGMASWDPEGNPELAEAEAVELGDLDEIQGAPASPDPKPAQKMSGKPKYTRPRAPVLLRPVQIELRRGAQQSWDLQLLDDFQINGVLTHVLNADRIRVDDEHVLDSDTGDLDDITDLQDAIEHACNDVADFSIEETIVIGAFSYAKQPMVDDVSDLDALEESDIVAALSGDSAAAERVRAVADDVTESTPDYKPVDAEFLVLDADASQSYVVNAALAGRNLVVEGPPGTGKSQTIANIIATSAAAGRTVLFVAQKRAAVSAVLDRLNRVDLNHLVLDVFAAASSRRFVADQLQEALDKQSTAGIARTEELHYSLTESRDRLVAHRNAMHQASRGWGVSVADLISLTYATPPEVQSDSRLPIATLRAWSENDLFKLKSGLADLSGIGGLDTGWSTSAGWAPSQLTNEEELRSSNELLADLQARHSHVTQSLADLAAQLDLPAPAKWADVTALSSQFAERDRIRSATPAALDEQYSNEDLHESLLATSRPYRKSTGLKVRGPLRRDAVRRAKSIVGGLPRSSRAPALAAALNLRTMWIGAAHYGAAAEWQLATDAATALEMDLAKLDEVLQGMSLAQLPLAELPAVFITLAKDPRRRVMPRAHAIRSDLTVAGLGALLNELEFRGDVSTDSPHRAGEVLDRVVTSSLLEEALLFDSDLASVTGRDLNRAAATFQQKDLGHLEANAVRIRRLVAERLKYVLDNNPDQHVMLKKEVTRKARFTPVRKLLREVPDVILAAKPVWAMSPLQVSRLLPREQLFDLVIFDEASQVKPSDAIPAILRGRQLIVAGDSRQLPPTEFFAKTLEDSDDSEEVKEDVSLDDEVDDRPPTRRMGSLTRDAESILFAMDRLLAGQSRRLLWHYRSRDERLIAVSNRHVYDNSLTTFPAADTPDAIEHIEVPYSPGIGGGTNSPEAEVAAVVDAVKAHALAHPDESLGVIAFGIKHQNRLELAFDKAFVDDPSLFDKLNAKEPFFIKSIERVQGDERDAIILTVGYGRGKDGQLRLFWGPLLQAGGDRRLNVAISRARLRLALVSSFSADDLSEDGHDSRGYKLMYQFIRFAASHGSILGDGPNRGIPLNAFEIDVRDRLQAAGLHLDPQVGVGSYRIDFAARHPTKPGRHVLAIEADGASYHSGHTARERDRLRQQLLERRGWVFHRIWSTDWFNDADGEVQAVLDSFEAAVDRADMQKPEPIADMPTAWELPVGRRQLPRPSFAPGLPIDEYPRSSLMEIVRWVRSDDVIRSSDDEVAVIMGELGFQRRGPRILRTIGDAQARVDGVS
jgi:very-short-patch-repair endonuclease